MTLVLQNIYFFTEDDEKGPMKYETTFFVTPPQEADMMTTEFNLNNLGRKLLCAEAEAY